MNNVEYVARALYEEWSEETYPQKTRRTWAEMANLVWKDQDDIPF